jgi:hypothetical protein
MNLDLLKQAIKDAKDVNMLVLSWIEGQFWGVMGWDNVDLKTVKRVSCHCSYCHKIIPLEMRSSHTKICTKEL